MTAHVGKRPCGRRPCRPPRRGLWRAAGWALCTTALAAVLFAAPAAGANLADLGQAARATPVGPFGALEFASEALNLLPQWNGVLTRVALEQPAFQACARDRAACKTASETVWREMLDGAAKLARGEQLDYVNRFFNRWPYRTDDTLYGVSEYWATPKEFMARSGDCEDYSIAKYYALRALGFGKDRLRVVVLFDRIRGVGHAVLAAYVDGDILILDNLSNLVLSHTMYQHYVPQYSLNETARWLHVAPGGKPLTN